MQAGMQYFFFFWKKGSACFGLHASRVDDFTFPLPKYESLVE